MSKKDKKVTRTSIGGQAVLEGVMMRGESSMATAVRDEDGIIRVETKRITPLKNKNWFIRLPIIRGVVNFFNSMVMGVGILLRSAEVFGGDEPTKFDKWLSKTLKVDIVKLIIGLGVVLGLGLMILLFILTPQWISELISRFTPITENSMAFNFIEGGLRMFIFICYILLTSLNKDIKRTYMYHGAEHKTISCFEAGKELTVENVKGCSRVHDRCGTTFMFFVILISILVFSVANRYLNVTGIARSLVKIALLPVVAGLSYELLKGLAKTDWWIFYPIKLPGLLLQRITTSEPDGEMIEVAITAFNTVLEMDADKSIEPKEFITARKTKDLLKDVQKILTDGGVTDESDGEWIVSLSSGIKRSELKENIKYLSPKICEKALDLAKARTSGRPLWYIVGNTEFYGYEFDVDERVLIPRPETEELVYNAIKRINSQSKVLDLCTGSGAIAITVNLKTQAQVTAVDVSEGALEVAKSNADKLGAKVEFVLSNMFENIPKENTFDVIISNPPYIKRQDMEELGREVKSEPALALDGGEDGLDFYRIIAENAKKYLNENGVVFLECGVGQAEDIAKLMTDFKSVEIIKDLNNIERIIKAEI